MAAQHGVWAARKGCTRLLACPLQPTGVHQHQPTSKCPHRRPCPQHSVPAIPLQPCAPQNEPRGTPRCQFSPPPAAACTGAPRPQDWGLLHPCSTAEGPQNCLQPGARGTKDGWRRERQQRGAAHRAERVDPSTPFRQCGLIDAICDQVSTPGAKAGLAAAGAFSAGPLSLAYLSRLAPMVLWMAQRRPRPSRPAAWGGEAISGHLQHCQTVWAWVLGGLQRSRSRSGNVLCNSSPACTCATAGCSACSGASRLRSTSPGCTSKTEDLTNYY